MYSSVLEHLPTVKVALNGAAADINNTLSSAGLGIYEALFELPSQPEKLFGEVGFNLKDDNLTSIFSKGMGIQSAVLLSGFCWISQQEKKNGKLSLWLIEEPESYLHPQLANQCLSLLKILGERAHVVMTTHSLGFVPQSPEKTIGISLEKKWTIAKKFKNYLEATKSIRNSLGVKFSDYYNFSELNILVEGQTDRYYLEAVIASLKLVPEKIDDFPCLLSDRLSIHEFGGVKGLEGFLRATHEFTVLERAGVSIFDGDEAGIKAINGLNGLFSKKHIQFRSNKEYVIIRDRFAIEGLLPDEWIREIYDNHPGWFKDYSLDAQGTILPFSIKDGSKDQYLSWFKRKISDSSFDKWSQRWLPVLQILEASLKEQENRLRGV